ncbi:hypothetical protein [Aquimarina litoralis]|uniref:hypothetical protein n=1 Tax=Aquimarina litoralis TaxID=584605 RepID=UPI001C57B6C1|nr:hypothetical protein [Aquimarina litoralis]MBW1296583.1 hypothetical protein [Aquimarina litoralis]
MMRHFKFLTLLLLFLTIGCSTDDDQMIEAINEEITNHNLAKNNSNNKELVAEFFENSDFTGRSQKVYLFTSSSATDYIRLDFTAKSWAIKKDTRLYREDANHLSQLVQTTVLHATNNDLYNSALDPQMTTLPARTYKIHVVEPNINFPESTTSFILNGKHTIPATRTYAGQVRSKSPFSDSPQASIPIWNSINFYNHHSVTLEQMFVSGVYDFIPSSTFNEKEHQKWHHAQFINKTNNIDHLIHTTAITDHERLGAIPDLHTAVRSKVDAIKLTSIEEYASTVAEGAPTVILLETLKKVYEILPTLGQKLDEQAGNIDNSFLRKLDCYYSIALKATHPENAANIEDSYHQCITRNTAGNIRAYSGNSLTPLTTSQKAGIYSQTNAAGKTMEDRLKAAKEKMEEVQARVVSFNRLSVRFYGANNEKFVMWYSYTASNGLKPPGTYPDPLGTQNNINDAFESMVTNDGINNDYEEVIILNDKNNGPKTGSTPDAIANCEEMIEFKNYGAAGVTTAAEKAINQFASLYATVKNIKNKGKITIGTNRLKTSLEKTITKNSLLRKLNRIPTKGTTKCLPIGFKVTFRFVQPNNQTTNPGAMIQEITEYTITKTQ